MEHRTLHHWHARYFNYTYWYKAAREIRYYIKGRFGFSHLDSGKNMQIPSSCAIRIFLRFTCWRLSLPQEFSHVRLQALVSVSLTHCRHSSVSSLSSMYSLQGGEVNSCFDLPDPSLQIPGSSPSYTINFCSLKLCLQA